MKKFLFGLLVPFALVSCNKNEVDNQPTIQKVGNKIIYFDNVNKEIAEDVAIDFFTDVENNPKNVTVANIDSVVDWDGKTAMYIFNLKPAGFVITSADVRIEPIISYSKDGYFEKFDENLPEALLFILDERMILNRWLQDYPKDEAELEAKGFPSRLPIIGNNIGAWKDLTRLKKFQVNFDIFDKIYPPIDPCTGEVEYLGETTTTCGYYCQTTWD